MPQPSDPNRDLAIRTILGEADPGTGEDSWRAIANVIHNRVAAGIGGKTPADVVLAKGQFEPWSARPKALLAIDPESKAYQQVGAVVDDVFSGKSPDTTGGATHFYSPKDQAALGRKPPAWAQGTPMAQIGGHSFYAPEGVAPGASAAPRSLFGNGGFTMPGAQDSAPPATAAPSSAAPEAPASSLFSSGGFTMPTAAPPAAPPQMIGNRVLDPSEVTPGAAPVQTPASAAAPPRTLGATLQDVRGAFDPTSTIPGALTATGQGIWDAGNGAFATAQSGVQDMRAGNFAPTLPRLSADPANARTITTLPFGNTYQAPGLDPQSGSAGGVLKTAGGLVGMIPPVTAISGASNTLGDAVTNATGNSDLGNKTAALSSAVAPVAFARGALKSVSENRAMSQIVKDVGDENIPAVIDRLKSNPRLTPMDVSPTVQSSVMGMAADPASGAQSAIQDIVNNRISGAKGSMKAAADEALGPPPDVAQTLADLKAKAQKTGKEMIEPVVAATKYVDVTPIVKGIDKQFDPAVLKSLKAGETPAMPMSDPAKRLWELRQQIRGDLADQTPGATDRMFMYGDDAHELQKKLRQMGSDPQMGFQARDVRRQLVGAIDDASPQVTSSPADFLKRQPNIPQWALNAPPDGQAMVAKSLGWEPTTSGTYKSALRQYADDKQVEEAFHKGYNDTFNGGGRLENHPDMWNAWSQDASANELEATRQGASIAADRLIRNVRRGLDVQPDSFAAERLATIASKPIADQFIGALNDERTIAGTNSRMFENSQTARRLLAAKTREVPPVDPFRPLSAATLAGPALTGMAGAAAEYASPGAGLWAGGGMLATGAALGAAKKAVQTMRKNSVLSTNSSYARLAGGSSEQDRNAFISALRARQAEISQGNKGSNALTVP